MKASPRTLACVAALAAGLACTASAAAQTAPAPARGAATPTTAVSAPPAPARPDSIRVESGTAPDTVTVGQPYRAVARITVPPGSRVEVTLAPLDSEVVEAAGQVKVDSAAVQGRIGAEMAFVQWRTGPGVRAQALLRVTSPRGETREVAFPFAAPFVRSVLPKDTAGIRPKGPKDVLDAPAGFERGTKLLGLGAIFFLLLIGLAYLLVRLLRRRRREAVTNPRERAVAALDELAASGVVERGDWRALYVGISDAMRELAASLSPGWGRDLTTGELAARLAEDDVPAMDVGDAAKVLGHADVVKFARGTPSPDDARADLATARAWVARIQPLPVPTPDPFADAGAEAGDRVAVGAGSGGGER
ncbi:MAG TPA: hypothetical protein VFH27_15290 [Longimicrobiaceae bacterium]|nr:hypothetical protein [Longimicrobiaceae bacterium]